MMVNDGHDPCQAYITIRGFANYLSLKTKKVNFSSKPSITANAEPVQFAIANRGPVRIAIANEGPVRVAIANGWPVRVAIASASECVSNPKKYFEQFLRLSRI